MHDTSPLARAKINGNGRIVIPKAMRNALGVKPGDEVMLRLQEEGVVIYTLARAVRNIQRDLRQHATRASIVDELIAERQSEFEREEAESGAFKARPRRAKHGAGRS